MTPNPDRDEERSTDTTAGERRTDTGDERLDESTGRTLPRRDALVGAGLGLGLLNPVTRASAGRPERPWNRDVDANGNDLLGLGGLNTAEMAEGTLITDFEGPNLQIEDSGLSVSDRLDVDAVDLEDVTAADTVSASTVDADDVESSERVRTPELTGGVTGGERLLDLAGDNLDITDGRLDATTHWRRAGALLEPSDDDVDGIEVEDVESPDAGSLNVEADGDLVLSVSGEGGAVRIETGGGHEIVLDDGGESESLSVEDSAGNSVEMDATTGEVSVSATERITLDAPTIELSADAELNIVSEGAVNLESDGNASLKSSGLMSLDGAIVQLNGSGLPAARQGDPVEDGKILRGSPTVLIG
jgi:hypothetical protein